VTGADSEVADGDGAVEDGAVEDGEGDGDVAWSAGAVALVAVGVGDSVVARAGTPAHRVTARAAATVVAVVMKIGFLRIEASQLGLRCTGPVGGRCAR